MRVIDSHTESEPTRVIVDSALPLGDGPLAQRARRFAREFNDLRSSMINEPRGCDALVGALLCEPNDKTCATGVIFFNSVGNLGMCGHATMGTAVTLAHLGRIGLGIHRFETPVGVVTVDLITANKCSQENVESYRYRKNVSVDVEGMGVVTGDIAWGGNWFFLSTDVPCPLTLKNIPQLFHSGTMVRQALAVQRITGAEEAEIDHIKFFGPAQRASADSRNFILCSNGAFDRSPCGTATSAKLACLAADGLLKPGEIWIQESIIGSQFVASYRVGHIGTIIPKLIGRAYICADSILFRDPAVPFADGVRISAYSIL